MSTPTATAPSARAPARSSHDAAGRKHLDQLLALERHFDDHKICFFGVTIGMFIGVLPGIGPLAAVAMILPVTYHLEPTSALIQGRIEMQVMQRKGAVREIILSQCRRSPVARPCRTALHGLGRNDRRQVDGCAGWL